MSGVTTAILIFLAAVGAIFAYYQYQESIGTSEILDEVKNSNQLLLASRYSDFELDAQYEVRSPKMGRSGGTQYDLILKYFGDYNARIESQWYVTKACYNNGTQIVFDRHEAIANGKSPSHDFISSKIDPPGKSYLLQIKKITPDSDNLHHFQLELFSTGQAITEDKMPLKYPTLITKDTQINFLHDGEGGWIPIQSWGDLNCDEEPPEHNFSIHLETTDKDEFHLFSVKK